MPVKLYNSVDAAHSDMTYALGFALTQWQTIELKLYQLFSYLCGQSDQKAVDVIFHEMDLDSRMRAILELVRLRDNKQLQKWDEVAKLVFKHKRLRDKLAHWTVVGAPAKDGKFTAYLCPPTTDPRAITVVSNPQNALNADDLRYKTREFQMAAGAIHRFMMEFPQLA